MKNLFIRWIRFQLRFILWQLHFWDVPLAVEAIPEIESAIETPIEQMSPALRIAIAKLVVSRRRGIS